MKKLLLLIPLLGFIGPAMAYSEADQRYDEAIGHVYRNAALPNQRGVCAYAEEARRAAQDLSDRKLLAEVDHFEKEFDCN